MSANSNDKIVKFRVFEEKEDDEVNAKTFEIHASNIPEESFLASLVRRVGEKTTGTRVNAKGEILVKYNVNLFSVIADYLEDKPIIYEIDANIRAAFDYFGIKFRDYPSEFLTIKRREDRFRSEFGTDPKLSNDPYYGLVELTFERYKEIVQSKHEVRSENANQLISDIDRKIGKNVPIFNYGNAKKNDQKQDLAKLLDNQAILDTYNIAFGTKSNVKVAMRGQNHGKKPNEEVKTISLTNVCNYGWDGVRCILPSYIGGADVAVIPDTGFCLSHTIVRGRNQGITEPCSKHISSGMFCHVLSNDMTLCPEHFSELVKKGEFPPLPDTFALDNDYFVDDEREDSSDNKDDNVSNNNNNNKNEKEDDESIYFQLFLSPFIAKNYNIVFNKDGKIYPVSPEEFGLEVVIKEYPDKVEKMNLTFEASPSYNTCMAKQGPLQCLNKAYYDETNEDEISSKINGLCCKYHAKLLTREIKPDHCMMKDCSRSVGFEGMTSCYFHVIEMIRSKEYPLIPNHVGLSDTWFKDNAKMGEIPSDEPLAVSSVTHNKPVKTSPNTKSNNNNNNNNDNNIDQDSELRAEYDLLFANLKNLTHGIEAELVGNGGDFFVAGGSIISIIFGSRISDIDLFYCGAGRDQGNDDNFIEKMTSIMYKKSFAAYPDIDSRVMITRTENSVTCKLEITLDEQIYDSHLKRMVEIPFQFILRGYKTPSEVLHGFDVDCCCIGYDGSKIWLSERCLFSLKNMINVVDFDRLSPTYERRLAKYARRYQLRSHLLHEKIGKAFAIFVPSFNTNNYNRMKILDEIANNKIENAGIKLRFGRDARENVQEDKDNNPKFLEYLLFDEMRNRAGIAQLGKSNDKSDYTQGGCVAFMVSHRSGLDALRDQKYIAGTKATKREKYYDMRSDDEEETEYEEDIDNVYLVSYSSEKIKEQMMVPLKLKRMNPGEQVTSTFHKLVLEDERIWYKVRPELMINNGALDELTNKMRDYHI
jgi:hypothetical protein